MLDEENGGFYGHMSNNFDVDQKHDKHIIMQLRCLWAFSIAARLYGNKMYGKISRMTYEYVLSAYWDDNTKGFIWQTDYLNNPIDERKFVYAQALGIYALSEYYACSKDESALKLAIVLFELLENRCKNADGKTYVNTCDSNWNELSKQRMQIGEDEETINVGVQLHVYEAYSNLYKHAGSIKVLEALQKLEILFLGKMYNPNTGLLYLYLDDNFRSTTQEVRPGHDVEFAWLRMDASKHFDEELRLTSLDAAINSIDTVRGLADRRTSTLFYLKSVRGKTIKIWRWWDQAEMILALWHAYQETGKESYLNECWACWNFVKKRMHIKKYGIWKWNVRSSRRGYKGYPAGDWKTPYHTVRSMALVSIAAGKALSRHSNEE